MSKKLHFDIDSVQTDLCDVLLWFLYATALVFGGKNESRLWENVENLLLEQITKLQKNRINPSFTLWHYKLCYSENICFL